VRSCAWPAPLPVHVAGVAAVTGMSLVVGLAGETYAYRPDAARHANPRYTDIAIVPESIGSMLTVVMLPAVPHTRPYRYGTRMRINFPSNVTESTPPESWTMRRSDIKTFVAFRAMPRAVRTLVSWSK